MQRFGTTFLRCTTDADFEPVTLEEAKLYCRIDTGSEEDSLLSCLLTAARQHAERKTGRVLRASTWTWRVEGEFPLGAVLPVPLAPCSACLSVSVDGEPLEASMYAFTPSGNGGNEAPLLASLTPLHGFPARGSVDVVLTAGWAADSIPQALKQWMLVRIGTLYEQRESFTVGANFNEFGHGFVDSLLDSYIVTGVV